MVDSDNKQLLEDKKKAIDSLHYAEEGLRSAERQQNQDMISYQKDHVAKYIKELAAINAELGLPADDRNISEKAKEGKANGKGRLSGIFKKKEQAEQPLLEEAQAQQEQPTKWERFKGGAGTVGGGIAKGTRYAAAGIGYAADAGSKLHELTMTALPAIIIIILSIIFGFFFHFFYPLLLILGLGIGFMIFIYHFSPKLAGLILVIVIVLAVVGVVTGPLGKQYGVSIEQLKLTAAKSTRASEGYQAQTMSTIGCVFGTGNCEQFQKNYNSEQANTEYVEGTKDVGVRLSDVRAARDFYENTPLEIQGIVNAKGFLNNEINVIVGATSEGIEGFDENELNALLGNELKWKCDGDEHDLVLRDELIKNMFFTCNHTAIARTLVEDEIITIPVQVSAKVKNTVSVSGKQFILTTQGTYRTGSDTPEKFDYVSDNFKSVQLGDESANLAIRATSDKDVLSAGVDNYIEVKLENPASHSGSASFHSLSLFLPNYMRNSIKGGDFNCNNQKPSQNEAAFLNRTAGYSGEETNQIIKCKMTVKPKRSLKPNDLFTWSLKLNVDESELIGDKTTFNVIAYVDYDYENTELLSVDVKGIGDTL